jgi:hypothetical protein
MMLEAVFVILAILFSTAFLADCLQAMTRAVLAVRDALREKGRKDP